MALSFSVPDTELSATLHNRRAEIVDNIFKGTAFMNALRRYNAVDTEDGGLTVTGSDVAATGGGGGGGAGGGIPGMPGRLAGADGDPGTHGGVGRAAVGGPGGAGQDTGGTGDAGNGGDGGDFGVNGDPGQTQPGHTYDGAPGAGGLAGKAIDYNGGAIPSYPGNTGSPFILGLTS